MVGINSELVIAKIDFGGVHNNWVLRIKKMSFKLLNEGERDKRIFQ